MSTHNAPGKNPWKTTAVRIAPSHVYVMALLLDNEYPFEPYTRVEHAALTACITCGWVHPMQRGGQFLLTDEGKFVAEVCRAAIEKASGGQNG